jgi:hypothetical protein
MKTIVGIFIYFFLCGGAFACPVFEGTFVNIERPDETTITLSTTPLSDGALYRFVEVSSRDPSWISDRTYRADGIRYPHADCPQCGWTLASCEGEQIKARQTNRYDWGNPMSGFGCERQVLKIEFYDVYSRNSDTTYEKYSDATAYCEDGSTHTLFRETKSFKKIN